MTTHTPEATETPHLNLQPLRDFVTENHSNHWPSRTRLLFEGIEVYVRMTTRVMGNTFGKTIDLADITIPDNLHGRKLFSRILLEFERLAVQHERSVYVESIVSPIIRSALARRGYSFMDGLLGSAWKSPESLQADLESVQASPSPF